MKRDDFLRNTVMAWPQVAKIPSGPCVIHTVYQHDDWCKTLKTGRGGDCNCNPTMRRFRQMS